MRKQSAKLEGVPDVAVQRVVRCHGRHLFSRSIFLIAKYIHSLNIKNKALMNPTPVNTEIPNTSNREGGGDADRITINRQTQMARSNIGVIISDQNRTASNHCFCAGLWGGVLLCAVILYLSVRKWNDPAMMLAIITAAGMSHWQLSMAAKSIKARMTPNVES
jgi:hypothetical protein